MREQSICMLRHPLAYKRCLLAFRSGNEDEDHVELFELLSRYEAIGSIGQGAYGFVCSARDHDRVEQFTTSPPSGYDDLNITDEDRKSIYDMHTLVAIKKLRNLFDGNQPRLWLCAAREIQLMMKFQHDNVMSAIDFFIPLGEEKVLRYESVAQMRASFDSAYLVMKKMDYNLREVLNSCTITRADLGAAEETLSVQAERRDSGDNAGTEDEVCDDANDADESSGGHTEFDVPIGTSAGHVLCRDHSCVTTAASLECRHGAAVSPLRPTKPIATTTSGVASAALMRTPSTSPARSGGLSDVHEQEAVWRRVVVPAALRGGVVPVCGDDPVVRERAGDVVGDGAWDGSLSSEHDDGKAARRDCAIDPDGTVEVPKGGEQAACVTVPQESDECHRRVAKSTIRANVGVVDTQLTVLRCLHTNLVLHPLPRDYRKFILYQILRGVGYMHQCGVIHRDLKPENILLDTAYGTCVTDFGQGRDVDLGGDEMSFMKTILDNCTQWYAAPETLSMTPVPAAGFVDHASSHGADVWSIGCIAAEMLVGRPLFFTSRMGGQMQLAAIVKVLGAPTERDICSLVHHRDKAERELFVRKLVRVMGGVKATQGPSTLASLLKSPYADEDSDEVALIVSCLSWDPRLRTTIQSALESAYFVKDDYEPTIADSSLAERAPTVRLKDIGDQCSGRSFLWNLFVQRHPEVIELLEAAGQEESSDPVISAREHATADVSMSIGIT